MPVGLLGCPMVDERCISVSTFRANFKPTAMMFSLLGGVMSGKAVGSADVHSSAAVLSAPDLLCYCDCLLPPCTACTS